MITCFCVPTNHPDQENGLEGPRGAINAPISDGDVGGWPNVDGRDVEAKWINLIPNPNCLWLSCNLTLAAEDLLRTSTCTTTCCISKQTSLMLGAKRTMDCPFLAPSSGEIGYQGIVRFVGRSVQQTMALMLEVSWQAVRQGRRNNYPSFLDAFLA